MRIKVYTDKAKLKDYIEQIKDEIRLELAMQVIPYIISFAAALQGITRPGDEDPNAYETGWFGVNWWVTDELGEKTMQQEAPERRGGSRDDYAPDELYSINNENLLMFGEKLSDIKRAQWLKGTPIYVVNNTPYTFGVAGLEYSINAAELKLNLALNIGTA